MTETMGERGNHASEILIWMRHRNTCCVPDQTLYVSSMTLVLKTMVRVPLSGNMLVMLAGFLFSV